MNTFWLGRKINSFWLGLPSVGGAPPVLPPDMVYSLIQDLIVPALVDVDSYIPTHELRRKDD